MKIIIIIIVLISNVVSSQNINYYSGEKKSYDRHLLVLDYLDKIEVEKGKDIQQLTFGVLYDKYILAYRGRDFVYKEYVFFFDDENNKMELVSVKYLNCKDILGLGKDEMFDFSLYWEGHINLESDFFTKNKEDIKMLPHNGSSFFFWSFEKKVIASYVLPFTVSPHPLNKNIRKFTSLRMLDYIIHDYTSPCGDLPYLNKM